MRLLAKEETPSDWISKKIGFYVLGHKGGAALRPNDFSNTGFPVIPKKAIQPTGELLIENPTYCTNEFASNNKRSIVDSSYAITTLRDLVPTGPTIGTVVNFSNEEKYILSQGVYGLKLNDALDKHYLSYLSNTAFYRKVMQRIMVGSTQVHIRTPEYLDLEIQIPPLPEQQKIAKILSTWDKAISTTERLIENSTQQKKALMQQLLTGKKRLLDESGKRFEGEWEEKTLIDAGMTVTDGDRGKEYPNSSEFYDEGDYLFLSAKNVTKKGFLFEETQFISKEKYEKLGKGIVNRGDVVLTTRGTVGQTAYYDGSVKYDFLRVNSGMVTLGCNNSELESNFFYALTNSSLFTRQVDSLTFGSAQPQLTIKIIKSLKVPIPSIPEQQKIATVLTNADKEIELLEQQLADLQQEKKALMQVLLTGKVRVVVDGES